jgi:hypothetical protein
MPIGIASHCSGTDFSDLGTRRTRAIYFAYTTKGRFITSQASDKRAIYRALISSLTNEIEMTALFRSARSDTFQLTRATSPLPTSAGAHIPAGRELMVLPRRATQTYNEICCMRLQTDRDTHPKEKCASYAPQYMRKNQRTHTQSDREKKKAKPIELPIYIDCVL